MVIHVLICWLGDLMIRNLNKNDAMVYNVEVINTENEHTTNNIELTVKRKWHKFLVVSVLSTYS